MKTDKFLPRDFLFWHKIMMVIKNTAHDEDDDDNKGDDDDRTVNNYVSCIIRKYNQLKLWG